MSALEDAFFHRTWWSADVQHSAGGMVLRPRPGALHIVLWWSTLEVFDNRAEPTQQLEAEVGDCLLVVGAGDEMAFVTVDRTERGALHVVVNAGALAPSTIRAQLLGANGLRQPRGKRRSRKARPLAPETAP